MKQLIFNFSGAFLFPVVLLAQSNTFNCNRIRNGTFYKYADDTQQKLIIIRKGIIQKEIHDKKRDTSFWNVSWQDACTYTLKFIRKSQPVSDIEGPFYSPVIFVKVLKITPEYYIFKGGLDSVNSKDALIDTLWFKHKK